MKAIKLLLSKNKNNTQGNYKIIYKDKLEAFVYFKNEPLLEMHNYSNIRKGAFYRLPFSPFKDRHFINASEAFIKELASMGYTDRTNY